MMKVPLEYREVLEAIRSKFDYVGPYNAVIYKDGVVVANVVDGGGYLITVKVQELAPLPLDTAPVVPAEPTVITSFKPLDPDDDIPF